MADSASSSQRRLAHVSPRCLPSRLGVFYHYGPPTGTATSATAKWGRENRRGSAVRPAIAGWYGGRCLGAFFRDHTAAAWEKGVVEG